MDANIIGREVRRLDEVVSTNDVVKAAAEQGEAEGLVVVARSQTNGRGRRGRVWISPPGLGLYVSVLLRPTWAGADAAWLVLLAGVATAAVMEELGAPEVTIKWPNDVFIRGKKVAGVLVEPRLEGGRIEFAVVGIGINVAHRASDWPAEIAATATSLQLHRIRATSDEVLDRLVRSLDRYYAATWEDLRAAWSRFTGSAPLPEVL